MIWIIGLGCFLGGGAIGALLFRQFLSDEVRIKSLEADLQSLSEEHEQYKTSVNNHFNNSAQLLGKLTESYRDVYVHMAEGARSLCPDYISNQLTLDRETRSLLDREAIPGPRTPEPGPHPAPPLDYATKSDPDQRGSLAEDYGFKHPGN